MIIYNVIRNNSLVWHISNCSYHD